MLASHEPPRTGLELGWTLFGIRVRISPTFFLVAALIAYLIVGPRPVAIAIDVACILFAILFTEIVQGIVYRSYGLRSTVMVQDFGGGVYPEAEPPTMLQRIVVAFAAPASSFLLFAIVHYSEQAYHWSQIHPYLAFAEFILWIISLFWGIIGLIPVYPYPMGKIMSELLTAAFGPGGMTLTLVISIFVAAAYIAYVVAVYFGHMARLPLPGGVSLPASVIVAIFFFIVTLRNIQILQIVRANRRRYETDDYGDRAPWDR
ncbi:MAG TPA: hypothetical protein VM597_35470 [Gemmataceae bacterium]|nr:hypothetical protein [Gemmataceae bacterium]